MVDTLETLLTTKKGIPGTEATPIMSRRAEINRRLPANITWLDQTWSWENVDMQKYKGGVVGAILTQAQKHAKTLATQGFLLAGTDFFAIPQYELEGKTKQVGWYRKTKLKYDKTTQSSVKQDPINANAEQIIYRRSYVKKEGGGVLFASYRFSKAKQYLYVEFMYSDFNSDFDTFTEYYFKEKLITE
ncbi:MAG: hypothetical protein AAF518_13880 [Spirochaetota bacterium]